MRTLTVMLSAIAIVLGFIVAYVDLHGSVPWVTGVLLLVFGFVLGYWHATQAWRWAIILGVWVPIAHATAQLVDLSRPLTASSFLLPLLSFVPSFAGTYLGVLVRRLSPKRPVPSKG